ncbi:MAG: thiolase family protein [Pseudomonadota bacterium]
MVDVVIAGYKRSPFTQANKGFLASVRPDEIISQVIIDLVASTKINVNDIEDLILGSAFPEGEQGLNLGRVAVFLSDLPESVGGMTVNRFCGSSMQAIHIAAGAIKANAGQVFICGGVESMSRIPLGGYNPLPHPELFETNPNVYLSMGLTAENIAKKYEINRHRQEEFSVNSHAKAWKAQKAEKFDDEIVPITLGEKNIEADGCIRQDCNLDDLKKLEPVFDKEGSVTAGTASPLTDGAAALIICSADYADSNNLPKYAKIKSMAISGCDPAIMGIGPVISSQKALKRANLTIDDIDIIELNEAFAVQSLACIDELKIDIAKVNIDGGAIAIGHPLGATGARIIGKAAKLLRRENAKYALATQCIGGGQGIATILEAL